MFTFELPEDVHRHKMNMLSSSIRGIIDATIKKTCFEILGSDVDQRYNVDADCGGVISTLTLTLCQALDILCLSAPDNARALYHVSNFVIAKRGVQHNPFVPLRHVHNALSSQSVPGDLIINDMALQRVRGVIISKDTSDPTSGWVYAPEQRLVGEPHAIWILTACEVIITMAYPYTVHSVVVDSYQYKENTYADY